MIEIQTVWALSTVICLFSLAGIYLSGGMKESILEALLFATAGITFLLSIGIPLGMMLSYIPG